MTKTRPAGQHSGGQQRKDEPSMQKQYSTKKSRKTIRAAALIIALAALAWLAADRFLPAERWEPDFTIPMANRNIEWTGAGYSGVYAHE